MAELLSLIWRFCCALGLTAVMNENIFKRLRGAMIGAIVIDAANTFWGQPRTYWSDPSTAYEHNPFVRFFARLGYLPFILYWVVYAAAAFFIVSRVPRRFAPIAIFTFILPHYLGLPVGGSIRGVTARRQPRFMALHWQLFPAWPSSRKARAATCNERSA